MFRLAERPGDHDGLYCGPDGLYLDSSPLIMRIGGSYRVRATDDIAVLIDAAYSPGADVACLLPGLCLAAEALQQGEIARAMIAALHLRLGEIPKSRLARLARVNAVLKSFNPDQPRVPAGNPDGGQWTGEGGADAETGDVSNARAGDAEAGGTSEREGTSTTPEASSATLRPGSEEGAGPEVPPTGTQTISGLASWYNLIGHRMANGQTFNPDATNAAMLRIPLGTVVTVRLVEDPSRSVIVTITDRGPYAAGRVIDLTRTAFKALTGSTNAGLVKVIVEVPTLTPRQKK
jgi:rare lipoprotein A